MDLSCRFACTAKGKSFHFVSSTAVFESQHYAMMTSAVRETDELVAGNGIPTGYGA
jgi:thioester reductase-like protein